MHSVSWRVAKRTKAARGRWYAWTAGGFLGVGPGEGECFFVVER